MQCPKAAVFDLDETLAVSFQAPRPEMLARLSALIERLPVAIMSGAGFERIHNDVIAHLPAVYKNLIIFPNSSSQCYMYKDGTWEQVYSHVLSEDERTQIKDVLNVALAEMSDLRDAPVYGERIIDREAQIAFTAVGQEAPPEVKASWDPTGEKRQRIARELQAKLPGFDILIGGASTIDFTRKDTNKSYGVRWFCEYLNTNPETLLYVGDALYPGGNDEVVILTGIQTHAVANPLETEAVIDELLAACRV
jgi:hypothetical protein